MNHEEPSFPSTVGTHEPVNNDKLMTRTKILLSLGECVNGIYTFVCGFYLNSYLLEVACLDPASVGMIQAASGIFDAVNDPLIGYRSDKTHTRWGRRRPWILFGGPLLGIFYFSIWNTLPSSVSETSKIAYYMVSYMGMSVGVTCVQVQISALTPELIEDYDQRTIVSACRLFAGCLAGLTCVMAHASILSAVEDIDLAYRISGGIFSVTIVTTTCIVFCGIEERFVVQQESDEKLGVVEGLQTMMKNRAFLNVLLMFVCGPTAIIVVQSNLYLYCKYVLANEKLMPVFMLSVMSGILIFGPFWVYMSTKFGKQTIYFFGGPALVLVFTCIHFSEDLMIVVPATFIFGSCLPVVYLAPYSMMPDVLEVDELLTGKRREGLFSGCCTIAMKLSMSVAMTATNFFLKLAGYSKNLTCSPDATEVGEADYQPRSVITTIKMLMSFFPAIMIIFAMLSAYMFPITKSTHSRTSELARIRREQNLEKNWFSGDPVPNKASTGDVKPLKGFSSVMPVDTVNAQKGPPPAAAYDYAPSLEASCSNTNGPLS